MTQRWTGKSWARVAAALAILCFATGVLSCKRTAEGDSRKEMKEREAMGRDLRKLRREVRMLKESTLGADRVDYTEWDRKGADPKEELRLLRREVFRLARAIDPVKDKAAEVTKTEKFEAPGTSQRWEVTVPKGSEGRAYTIRNVGETMLEEPHVVVDGVVRTDSAEDILGDVLGGKTTDEEKAVALWDFVRKSRQHYFPSQAGEDSEDPVKLANVYGYGYCDDAATALAWLARVAGYPVRLWDLEGHVVPEISYGNGWHMLDPDEEVYYRDEQGAIASVDWLARHPETITSLQGGKPAGTARLAAYYTSTEDNRLLKIEREVKAPPYRLAYSLRPGEEVRLSGEPSGKFFSAQYYWSHPPTGSGKWRFAPVAAKDLFKVGAERAENLKGEGDSLSNTGGEANLTYRFAPGYPMLDGMVSGTAEVADGAAFLVEFSADGKTWSPVAEVRGPKKKAWQVSLKDCFPNGYGEPLYVAWLRWRMPAGKPGSVRVADLKISLDLQVAPKAVPTLPEGTTKVRYEAGGGTAEVMFELMAARQE